MNLVSTYFCALTQIFQSWSHTVEAERVTATQPCQVSSLRSLKPPWSISPKWERESHLDCQRVRFHRRNCVAQNLKSLKLIAELDLPAEYPAPPSSLRSNSLHVTGEWAVSGQLARVCSANVPRPCTAAKSKTINRPVSWPRNISGNRSTFRPVLRSLLLTRK